ncbi:MAG: hypothetical protein GF411_11530 [Candidatus Lokiarchaeota archaeon]|nr:hypothetical protein [Candidatus Lokiarchaeota archaeon]
MKRSSIIIILLTVPLFIGVGVLGPTPAAAWGHDTHRFILSESLNDISNSTWRNVFEFYAPELLSGCVLPDVAWQDWDNHLYYPETGEYTAPDAAKTYFDYTVANFSMDNWVDGFVALGVMTHYFSDPCIPVHTGDYWDGHSGYETDINNHLDDFILEETSEVEIQNISQLVVDCATYSHQYYDEIVSAYPSEESTAIMTNPSIKSITEDCLSMAINGCVSLFYTIIQDFEPPDISTEITHVALVDYAHNNDYIDVAGQDQLSTLNLTLFRNGFELRKQTSAISAMDLIGVDLLIITCALEAYSSSELSAISTWAQSGNNTLIITGRGDYSTYVDIARTNSVLEALGSDIRVNDDNVYMDGTYQPFYNDLTNILQSEDSNGLTENVESLTFFSPSSLYFINDSAPMPIIYADKTAYQTDQNSPEISVVYDDVQDGKFGNQIILAAIEEIGNLRLIVTGTTFFSNFDYEKSAEFDNIVFLENILDWGKCNRILRNVQLVDEVGPRIGMLTTTATEPISEGSATFSVTISDPSGVLNASLEYDLNGRTYSYLMTLDNNQYTVTMPNPGAEVNIRVISFDVENNKAIRGEYVFNWSASMPIEFIFILLGIIAVAGITVALLFIKTR